MTKEWEETVSQQETETTEVSADTDVQSETLSDDGIIPDTEAETEPVKVKKHRIRAPLVIAACIVLLTAAVILIWAGFFYKSIKGCWKYIVTVGEGDTEADYTYVLSFEDDHVCRYNLGGTTYTGKYKIEQKDGRETINVIFTQLGREIYRKSFYYETEGNFFSERTLSVTDLDGMILPPDDLSNEVGMEVSLKKKLADSTEQDGKRYYIIPFRECKEISPRTKSYDNFKSDSKLTGIWYEANENSGFGYTFTFHEDGTYELIYSDTSYTGCYTAENGECRYNLLTNDGQELENKMNYSFEEGNLILDVNGQKSTLVHTDNQFAFRGAIK